jgi:CDP-diacylglycerol--glycerol-3-phosphate 3-phosphatidyltransferase
MLTFKNFNIADWFSFYRIACSPLLLYFLWIQERELFVWFLLVSYSTDLIDGFLARKFNMTSPRGSQLDSFGDQITVILGFLGLLVFEYNFILNNYILIIIAFIPYIIQMLIAYTKFGKATSFHTYLAKLSAVSQAIFILSALFFSPDNTLFYIMIVLGFLETIEEIILIFLIKEWASDIKGIYWVYKKRKRKINS